MHPCQITTVSSRVILLLSICAPIAAYSQTAEETKPGGTDSGATSAPALQEIVVTAQKRSENLQNVAISVTAYTAADLKAENVTGLTDLQYITPALSFSFVGGGQAPFLRGVGSNSAFPGSEAEVQTYVDGVYYASQVQGLMKFNNISNVEVDKGPQGTLFGRNATGGIIQITTRDPSEHPSADMSAGYGSYNLREADFYATTGVAAGLAADLAVHFDDQDGWGRNIATGNDAWASSDIALRSKWLWTISDVTRLTFIADYARDRNGIGATNIRSDGICYTPPGGTVPGCRAGGFYDVDESRDSYNVNEQGGVSLKVQTQLGALPLVSITAFRRAEANSIIDGGDVPYFYEVADPLIQKEDEGSQEFQLLSPKDWYRLQWIIGSYLYYDRGLDDPLAIAGGIVAPAQRVDNYSSMTTHSFAGYGQATWNLTDSTHFTGGVRFTQDYRKQSGAFAFILPPPIGAINQPGVNNYPKADFNAWTGKASLSQDFTDHIMGYVSYNRGWKSGLFNTFLIFSNPLPAANPEYIDAYEGGLKTEFFDRRLRLNASVFYYGYSDLQVEAFTANDSILLKNAASAHIKGGDADFEAALTSTTRLQGGVSFVDAVYSSFPNAPEYLPNPITSPNPGDGGFGGLLISSTNATGNRMPFAPKFSADINLNQDIAFSAGSLGLNIGAKYQSKMYFTPDDLFSQNGYTLLSASTKWTPRRGNWYVTLWGSNLTAVKAFAIKTPSGFGVNSGPIPPATVGVRVGYHFD